MLTGEGHWVFFNCRFGTCGIVPPVASGGVLRPEESMHRCSGPQKAPQSCRKDTHYLWVSARSPGTDPPWVLRVDLQTNCLFFLHEEGCRNANYSHCPPPPPQYPQVINSKTDCGGPQQRSGPYTLLVANPPPSQPGYTCRETLWKL